MMLGKKKYFHFFESLDVFNIFIRIPRLLIMLKIQQNRQIFKYKLIFEYLYLRKKLEDHNKYL